MENFKDFRKRFYIAAERDVSLFDTVQSYTVNPTYNTKCKLYPDGSKNLYYAPVDLYGRNEHNKSYKHEFKNVFQLWLDVCKQKFDMFKLQNEYFETRKLIQVYFNSVQHYLDFSKKMRDYDLELDRQCTIMQTDSELTNDERVFINSLDNSIRHDNLKRAKDSIYDLVYSNEWDYFFTGTLDENKIDRNDIQSIRKHIQKWLNNMRSRYNISYILIFEYHKKGGIHTHGLIKEFPLTPLNLVPSDTKIFYGFKKPIKQRTAKKYGLDWDKGQTVYNLSTWKFGFSTAIKVYGDKAQLSHYITKYITKDNKKIMGRYYWHSRDLKKPKVLYYNTDISKLDLPVYHGWRFELQLSEESKRKIQQYSEWVELETETENNDFLSGFQDIIY